MTAAHHARRSFTRTLALSDAVRVEGLDLGQLRVRARVLTDPAARRTVTAEIARLSRRSA